MARLPLIAMGLIGLLGLALALWPPSGMTGGQGALTGLVIVTLGLWGTSVIPPHLTTMGFFVALLVSGLAPPEVVFAGFSSAAMWLVVAGFVIGAAISGSGLGARIGAAVAPYLGRSYPALVAGMIGLGLVLLFLMPSSMGRAAVMVPIAMALAQAMGLERGSTGRSGVAVAVALVASLPGFTVLPANIPNMVLAGASERILGHAPGYADYLLLHFPVLGLLKAGLILWLVLRVFPARAAPAAPASPSPATLRQGLLAGLLLVTLGLWASDSLHGVSPAWVGLGLAVVLMAPGIGLVSAEAFRQAVDFRTLMIVAGALGLGTVVSAAGLGTALAPRVIAALPLAPGQDLLNFLSLAGLAAITALLTTQPGVPAVLTPLAPDLALAAGLSPETAVMVQVVGFSTVFLPYQVAPLIVAMGLAQEPLRALVRVLVPLAALTILVLWPLDFLWWRLIGAL